MMNLLARILSHGFAFAVVVIIVIVLMYRGELSPEWELPEFLVIKSQTGTQAEADSGTVERTADETTVAPEPPEESEEPLTPVSMDDTSKEVPSADEMPAAGQTDDVAPLASSNTATATDTHAEETSDELSITDPATSGGSIVQASDDATVPTNDAAVDETSATVEDSLSTVTDETAPADTAPAATEEAAPADTAPAATEEAAPADTTPAATEGAAPAETTPAATEEAAPAETTPAATEEAASAETTPAATEEAAPAETTPAATEEAAPAETTPAATEEAAPVEATPAAIEEAAPVETTPATVMEPESTPDMAPATEPLAAPDKEDVPKVVADAATETPYEVMAKARESFWLRDFDAAEQHYRKLIQIDPDNPDGYGEMGNMYFSQGKWDEAAASYYEAGTRLLNEGRVVQARQMVVVIRGLNSPQAGELEAQVVAASPTSP
jgi:hypothetical protein